MPGKQYGAGTGYRYGFNGNEMDNEVSGQGNQYDYGFRIYNPRIGRFLSVDPLTKNYPSWSPYPFAMNRPIDGIDLDGLEYLKSSVSKIDISITPFTFNGKTVLTGQVLLDLDNVSDATKGYILNRPWKDGELGSNAGVIATFEHKGYQDLVEQSISALSSLLKQPTLDDAEPPNSLKQPEINILRSEQKVSRISKPMSQRYDGNRNRKAKVKGSSTNSSEVIPSGVGTGTVKGDAIIAMVSMAGEIMSAMGNSRIGKDYNTAEGQLISVGKVLNDVQFAVDNKLISENISEYTNYLLDGRIPKTISTFTDRNGITSTKEFINTALQKKFEEIISKVEKKRQELDKCCGSTN